jgi:F-type H+-transporting ATPase subunit epsilon
MQLKVLLPSRIFLEVEAVARIVALTSSGSLGILPRRLNCATALVPGLLTYALADGNEVHLAVDEGILLKTGAQVLVCVRDAVAGDELSALQHAVEEQFLKLTEDEHLRRTTLAELEGGFVRRLLELQRGAA